MPSGSRATESAPSSPDAHVRKRGRPPFIPCAGQACGASILTPPGSLPPHRQVHLCNRWTRTTALAAAAKCLAAFQPTYRHRSAARCQRSSCERWKPPTLMQRSAVPPRPVQTLNQIGSFINVHLPTPVCKLNLNLSGTNVVFPTCDMSATCGMRDSCCRTAEMRQRRRMVAAAAITGSRRDDHPKTAALATKKPPMKERLFLDCCARQRWQTNASATVHSRWWAVQGSNL